MMVETIIAAVISFVGTNIDDIFINTFFFTQADTKKKIKSVVVGKYLGIGALVLLSCLGAYGLQFIPQQYIRFLGLVPIALGLKEWLSYRKSKKVPDADDSEGEGQTVTQKGFLWNVVLVTISCGADNIGIYIPLFAGYTMLQMAAVVVVFSGMIGVWCFLGKKLADLPGLRDFLLRYKHVIVPVVFIVLGIYILFGG